ncbi:MAG: hypothetical protein Phyf2KO_07840 [Phycisphaerales bacterium]
MDETYKPNHLGLILIVSGLILLVATIGGGGWMLVAGASKVFDTIESDGTHTVRIPAKGEYVLARDANIDADSNSITVTPINPAVSFRPDTSDKWIVIGEQRHLVLGTLTVPERGDQTLEITADAYPITLRHEPMAMANRVMTIFAVMIAVPIIVTIIGIVVSIRNTNKRNKFLMEQMI